MAEESKLTATVQNRRAFVKTAAKVAVTAPAAAMLLNASVKPAKAGTFYGDDYSKVVNHTSDDSFIDDNYRSVTINTGDDFIP